MRKNINALIVGLRLSQSRSIGTLIFVCIALIIGTNLYTSSQIQEKQFPYQNPILPIEQRLEDLLNRMTLEEKVYQLCALRLGDGDEILKNSGDYSIDYIRQQFG